MLEAIKKNKLLILILSSFFIILLYCSLNTMILNDDLGYSFLYRTDVRITNLVQVLKMQISDYKIVSSRVFVHSIVQALLIFGKNVWSILNPIIIILNFYLIDKIIGLYKNNSNKLFNYLFGLCCFLLIVNFKWIIYWVAGSVNYVWTSTFLFLFIYLYLRYGLNKKMWVNMLLVLIISIIHESTFVFTSIFVVLMLMYDLVILKKFERKKLLLFIPIIISGVFLFLGPGTFSRIGQNEAWNKLNLIEKLNLSLPVVSYNMYNLKNIYNVIPIIFIVSVFLSLIKSDNNLKYIFISVNILVIFLALILNNNWLYFVLSITILLSNFYINYIHKRENLNIMFLSFYAISYSLCLTVEYISGRPNYFTFICMIMLAILYLYDAFEGEFIKLLSYILIVVLVALLCNEAIIYSEIGKLKEDRLIAIENYKKGKTNKLIYKLANKKYYKYQIDINEPYSKNYYAYKYFLNYYGLPEDVTFEYIEEGAK